MPISRDSYRRCMNRLWQVERVLKERRTEVTEAEATNTDTLLLATLDMAIQHAKAARQNVEEAMEVDLHAN